MDHVPFLWTVAHVRRRPAAVRALACRLLRLGRFLRAMAVADHYPFGGL